MARMFLHTCCGPCFFGVWADLRHHFEVTNFFYNPNIQPKTEYDKRLENLKKVALGRSQEIIEGAYDGRKHQKAILGLETNFPKRCLKCYELRLTETAKMAQKLGYELFSTTLLVSPYQQHEQLKQIGQKLEQAYNLKFYYRDWRPLFRSGQQSAKDQNIYRQRYCGCQWSEIESRKTFH